MNSRMIAVVLVVMVAVASGFLSQAASAAEKTLSVLVVTGGHDYDQKAFPQLFEGQEGMKFTQVRLKDESEIFEDISDFRHDVIVFYNMTQKISPKRQENFKKLLDRGVGVVALHHCICGFQDWPEYSRIIGGKYLSKETEIDGVKYKPSSYKHDIDVAVKVADANHPITRGVKDFTLKDETYKGQWVDPKSHILLTTTEPTSDSALAWCKTYGKARTAYIQLGHGPQAYSDKNYKTLLGNAIRWTAEK